MPLEARRIRKKSATSAGGLESLADFVAIILLVLGVLASAAALLSLSWFGLIAFVLGSFASLVIWLLFRSIAEIIRLLKKMNGLPYSGAITSAGEVEVFACSHCGMMLHSTSRCDGCGATIVSD